MWDFLDDEARERARRDRERRLRGVTEVVENTLLHADGHQVWVRVNATPTRDEEGRINGSLAVLSDVTHQRAMERALAEREHRYALLVEHLPGSAVLVLDRDLRIVTAGGSAVHEFGHTAAGLVGRTVTDLVPAGDTAYLAPRLAAALAGGTSGTFEYRHSPSGRVLVIDAVPLTREGGRVGQILVAARDVTELKDAESRLAHLADHDPLTGLLNRRGFTAALRRHAALVRRYGPDGALLMVDLDEFKRVNDTYGHQGGDEVIVAVAARLLHTLRDSDVAARLGGDEFAVLLTRGGQADAETVAGRIVRAAREGSRDRAVTVSVGVALFDGSPGEIVLGNADRAMYAAKAAGRDRWCVHAGAEPPTAS
jgi:diguanylate cyclase (GGDEF)-like protein/PAS domain S-box-containing protein